MVMRKTCPGLGCSLHLMKAPPRLRFLVSPSMRVLDTEMTTGHLIFALDVAGYPLKQP